MDMYFELHKARPALPQADMAGGWVVAIMPFLEEQATADELMAQPSLLPPNVSPLAKRRLPIMTCPAVVEELGDEDVLPRAHYGFYFGGEVHKKFHWGLFDVPLDTTTPWVAGAEMVLPSENGPHGGRFMRSGPGGAVEPWPPIASHDFD